MGCYVFLQFSPAKERQIRAHLVTHATAVGGLAILGAGLSAIQLGPLIAWREQFMRMGTLQIKAPLGFQSRIGQPVPLQHAHKGRSSMSSAYVTLPIVLFRILRGMGLLKKNGLILGGSWAGMPVAVSRICGSR